MKLLIKGGGYSGFWYNYGYLKYMSLQNYESISAYSSGALALVIHLAQHDLETVIHICLELYNKYSLNDTVFHLLSRLLPENIHIIMNDYNINIIATESFLKTKMYASFTSKTDVIHSVMGSCFIPFISGLSLTCNETKTYDGTFHLYDTTPYDEIIHCNCYDIRYIFFPMKKEHAMEYYSKGIKDFLKVHSV